MLDTLTALCYNKTVESQPDIQATITAALTDPDNISFLVANFDLVVATSVNGSPSEGAALEDQLGAVLELGVLALLEGQRACLSPEEFEEYGIPTQVAGLRLADEHGDL